MMNLLSYVGVDLHSEVCLWTLVGLLRTIFDATLFKVNSNLKQVWQMTMPDELSKSVQRILRTMISGVMLVQCFTVYVYLAAYIVLLYPVFLEEKPVLVLPWLLLTAVKSLLCELMSLALGLGTCVLLGPARSPCVKFLIVKLATILPSFYMWLLVLSYYHVLKVATLFKKTFPMTVLPVTDIDDGLELAIRRRRTKSLQGEDQLRSSMIANFYTDRRNIRTSATSRQISYIHHSSINAETSTTDIDNLFPLMFPYGVCDTNTDEDLCGIDVSLPRDTDRILEQFCIMCLRIAACKTKDLNLTESPKLLVNKKSQQNLPCTTLHIEDNEPPSVVGSSQSKVASYVQNYPQIFQKKQENTSHFTSETAGRMIDSNISATHSHDNSNATKTRKRKVVSKTDSKMEVENETVLKNTKLETTENEAKTAINNNGPKTDNTQDKKEFNAIYKSGSASTTSTLMNSRKGNGSQGAITTIANVLDIKQESPTTSNMKKRTDKEK